MSSSPSPMMQDLFAAARDDAPSAPVRDAVWGRVAATTALPAAAGAAAIASKASAIPAAKLLALGAVIGAVGAVIGVLAVLPSVSDEEVRSTPHAPRVPAVVMTGQAAGARLAEAPPRPKVSSQPPNNAANGAANGTDWEIPTSPTPAAAAAAAGPAQQQPVDDASALAEEARLVTEARSALMRGEPERALALSRSTRKLRTRMLEPEELALEARALRALGRTDEALATELTLRHRFPNHALSR